ncbi:TonB-dependent receptor [Sphingomonas sabuli]|uniref:TonB-dependent receptor n=1 Tax=Sphingomonas sabuli TaxID=2764186 RepID=A0A7G9L007_9SPHN|nr:TonB-dependent receptor [Sphingomonas sabuli]QNM81956.1 TonB-dependent receptor [Sphingomonas sabuli]
MVRFLLSGAATVALFSVPVTAVAQQAQAPAAPQPGPAAAAHSHTDDTIIVTGVRRNAGDVLGGVSVLETAELARSVRTSIGETLAKLPGVSATSFGPAASAPVIRGLSGDRIRVLVDGIGTLDLASAGPDHAVAIDPLTAERIEVLRGPAALPFGSSAIGGVVNVIDTRIPRRMPEGGVSADGLLSYGSAAEERSANAALNVALGGNFVLHADGKLGKSDDVETGGYILARLLREEAAASADPAIRALADLKGELPNSASKSQEGALGLAYVDGGLNIGASISRRTQEYDVPVRYSLDPAIEVEAPTIDLEQTRYDGRVEIPLAGFFRQVSARGGYARYHHDEVEETGEIGSSFFSNGGEVRVDLVQADRSGWAGTSGIQYLDRDVRIRGEEKYLPDARQKQAGLFTVQTLVAGPVRLEGGARIEFSELAADADAQIATPARNANFTTVSASLGGQYDVGGGWRAGLSLSHSERAPNVEELFSNGPHGGSQSFQVGNPGLDPEKSNGVELSLRRTTGPVHVSANVYYSRFSNFLFAAPTGAIAEDLPVYEFRAGKADYLGFELSGDARLGSALGVDWGAEFQADAVRATVRDFGPAPLIPPLRMLGALTGVRGPIDGRIELERAFAHDRTAPNETRTPGYTLVNAAFDWHAFADRPELTLSLQANNIFDVEARRSTSLLKDYAPLPGRDIRLSARVAF